MSKRERTALNNYTWYLNSTMRDLNDAYTTYSAAKARAFSYCKDLQYRLSGYDFKIISKNSFMFTAGFTFADPETGVLKFMHITPSYDTAVEIPAE